MDLQLSNALLLRETVPSAGQVRDNTAPSPDLRVIELNEQFLVEDAPYEA